MNSEERKWKVGGGSWQWRMAQGVGKEEDEKRKVERTKRRRARSGRLGLTRTGIQFNGRNNRRPREAS